MSKSNKYGYSGVDIPTQAAFANVGKFDPAEINELVQEDKWTTFGQLELIETQTVSGTPTTIDFTAIKETEYNVHFMTYNNMQGQSTTAQDMSARLSNDGGATFETSNYMHANRNYSTLGVFTENKSSNTSRLMIAPDLDNETNASVNGYIYFYNLGDSTKYTFVTDWNILYQSAVGGRGRGGGAVYKGLEQMNGIRLYSTSSGGFSEGVVSLYGIKEY
tara:strand:+ start:760 stop:1416 length:657 start_codon:yes stop_codon:yes gene_type:complete